MFVLIDAHVKVFGFRKSGVDKMAIDNKIFFCIIKKLINIPCMIRQHIENDNLVPVVGICFIILTYIQLMKICLLFHTNYGNSLHSSDTTITYCAYFHSLIIIKILQSEQESIWPEVKSMEFYKIILCIVSSHANAPPSEHKPP